MSPTMHRVTTSIAFAFAVAPIVAFAQPRSTAEIMAKKLELARQLVGDIVLEDHEAIREAASELDHLSEFQSWFVLPTEEYARSSEEFRAAAQALVEASGSEDGKAASEAYAVMLGKCLQCHQYMSTVREPESRRRAAGPFRGAQRVPRVLPGLVRAGER